MLAPLLVWATTGMVFFIKPGYQAAYEPLPVKSYPLEHAPALSLSNQNWHIISWVRTVLGEHLMVLDDDKPQQLNAETLLPRPAPKAEAIRILIDDAIADKRARYGHVESIDGLNATTSTGIKITLDWQRLQLTQYGNDRALIEQIYKLHYLQWTPWPKVNDIVGILGLFLLIALTMLGARLFFKKPKRETGQ